MGTPGFVVPVLDALHDIPEIGIAAVYTPPDRRRGRGQMMEAPPVKERARELTIPVEQPNTFRDAAAVDKLAGYEPDVIVVAAYGRLLPPDVLGVPRRGCVNLHPSILPRHRGPSPVAGAILAGDEETGVTLMQLDEGMDTGPVIAQRTRSIGPNDDAESLTPVLFADGAELLVEMLPAWLEGHITPVSQNDRQASYTAKLERADGAADWRNDAARLARMQRAYAPWPGLHTRWKGREIKLLAVAPVDGPAAEPGVVGQTADAPIAVGTGSGLLAVHRLQLEGRRPVEAGEFLRGQPDFIGVRLGE